MTRYKALFALCTVLAFARSSHACTEFSVEIIGTLSRSQTQSEIPKAGQTTSNDDVVVYRLPLLDEALADNETALVFRRVGRQIWKVGFINDFSNSPARSKSLVDTAGTIVFDEEGHQLNGGGILAVPVTRSEHSAGSTIAITFRSLSLSAGEPNVTSKVTKRDGATCSENGRITSMQTKPIPGVYNEFNPIQENADKAFLMYQ